MCQYTETEEILKILILKFLVNFLNFKFGLIFWNSGSRAIEASSSGVKHCSVEILILTTTLSRSFYKIFPEREYSFGEVETFIRENNSCGITDFCPGYGQLQITHTLLQRSPKLNISNC